MAEPTAEVVRFSHRLRRRSRLRRGTSSRPKRAHAAP
jgi:hypothetical protein